MTDQNVMSRRDMLRKSVTAAAAAGLSITGAALAAATPNGAMSMVAGAKRSYKTFALRRSLDGVVTLTLNTQGSAFILTLDAYEELAAAFVEVSLDPDSRVLVIEGAGDYFIKDVDFKTFGDLSRSLGWLEVAARGRRMIQSLIDVDIPVVAAVNGPALLHSEVAFLADVVISAENAWFEDPHMHGNVAPGDGIHVVWQELFGINRARSYLMLSKRLSAVDAHTFGAIAELTASGDQAKARAAEIAHELAKKPAATLRAARYVMTRRFSRLLAEGIALGWYGEAISALAR
ncbi:enoyl-CoA hydratase/isomerase family protein [Dyella psychrodurans]|nr:enoyl-CoA hydratase/isomerase family protein [Dyella psychrodurans]